jgi:hypothetical protein
MRHILLALIFVLAALPLQAEAQSEPPGWEFGWVSETDPQIMELNGVDHRITSEFPTYPASGDMSFSLSLEFWVDNQRPIPVEIGFDFVLSNGDFVVDIPETTTIDGQSNESFTVVISGDGFVDEESGPYLERVGDDVFSQFTLTAGEKIADQGTGTQRREIEKGLQFSRYNAFMVYRFGGVSTELHAGTGLGNWQFNVDNFGNVDDTITDVAVEIKSCPQLVIEGQEGLIGARVYGYNQNELTVTAPQSHPAKTCEVTIKVRSEGSGLWYANNPPFTFDVIAPEAGDDTNDDTSSSDQEAMGNDLEINDSGILPSLTILSTLSAVGFAAIFRREKR